jgi:hypothetical protein
MTPSRRPPRGERWADYKRFNVDLLRKMNHAPFAFGLLSLTAAGLGIWSLATHAWRWWLAIAVLDEAVLGALLIIAYFRLRDDS